MRGGLFFGLIALTPLACVSESPNRFGPRGQSVAATDGDPCAPGKLRRFEEDPDGTCVLKTERHVVDLTQPQHMTSSIRTQNLPVLGAAGAAPAPLSCAATGPGLSTCGVSGDKSCCERATVPAGTADAQTTVAHDFDLGVYLVTAGRLRAFVETFAGNVRGAANTFVGFDQRLADQLPASRGEVDTQLGPGCQFRNDPRNFGAATWWTPDVEAAVAELMFDDNERAADIRAEATKPRLDAKPANCVSYAVAAAYCAWDGGRLPSNTEWIYAALGGNELRTYPWGADRDATRLVTDLNRTQNGGVGDPKFTWPEDFPFFDNGMNAYHIGRPGLKPAGKGRWGHHDMGGDVLEWMADVTGPNAGIVRGGSWEGHPEENAYAVAYPLTRTYGSVGFRCAYGAVQSAPVAPPSPAAPPQTHVIFHSKSAAASHGRGGGDHLYSLSDNEGAPVYFGAVPAFRLETTTADPATQVVISRCRNADGTHYLSTQDDCEGMGANEGPLGVAERRPAAGTQQLFRCVGASRASKARITTLNPVECDAAGMRVEGSQGFAFPN